MRRLLILVVLALVAGTVARRMSAGRSHGTPDSWPAVPRKA
jgi:hypothetical protein